MFFPELIDEGYPPHKIHQLYLVGHDEADIEVDITAEIDLKLQALACHKSQFDDLEEAMRRWRERWGERQPDGSVRYFERFKGMRFR